MPLSDAIGFGCAGLAQLPDAKSRQELLEAAFDSGIRHFDVARMYGLGTAEAELGRFLKGRRDEVTVATKFGLSFSAGLSRASKVQSVARWIFRQVPALRAVAKKRFGGSTDRDYSVDAARASFETSLFELGVERVDYLFLHDPKSVEEVPPDLLPYLESLKAAGKARRIGLATELAAAEAIAAAYPALGEVVQIPAPPDAALGSPFLVGRTVFRHGVLQRNLPLLKARDPKPLADALGVATLSAEALGASVLLHARSLNPGGKVLFFSSSPARVRETMRVLSGVDEAAAAARVAAVVGEAVR